MKTRYASDFLATLERCGVSPERWRMLSQTASRRRYSSTPRKTIQWCKRLQRIHTGAHLYFDGVLR